MQRNASGIKIHGVQLAAQALLLELQITHKGAKLENRCNLNYDGIIEFHTEGKLKDPPLNYIRFAPSMQEVNGLKLICLNWL